MILDKCETHSAGDVFLKMFKLHSDIVTVHLDFKEGYLFHFSKNENATVSNIPANILYNSKVYTPTSAQEGDAYLEKIINYLKTNIEEVFAQTNHDLGYIALFTTKDSCSKILFISDFYSKELPLEHQHT